MKEKEEIEKIVCWIKEEVESAGADGVVLGLSGGLDSAVVSVLAKKAFPDDTLALILPCFSDTPDVKHAKLVSEKFDINTKTIDLSSVFSNCLEALCDEDEELYKKEETEGSPNGKKDVATINIKPRLRMICLYYFANKLNYLVLGTGNKSELSIGYFTKHGDGGCDLLPIGSFTKTKVRTLAKELGIPEEIVNKEPSAGLWPGQTDETEMGITYSELDSTLLKIENDNNDCVEDIEEETKNKVKTLIQKSEHKRRLPKICKF